MARVTIAEVADTGFDCLIHAMNILLAGQKDKPKLQRGRILLSLSVSRELTVILIMSPGIKTAKPTQTAFEKGMGLAIIYFKFK